MPVVVAAISIDIGQFNSRGLHAASFDCWQAGAPLAPCA
jgi:hypothetical protein